DESFVRHDAAAPSVGDRGIIRRAARDARRAYMVELRRVLGSIRERASERGQRTGAIRLRARSLLDDVLRAQPVSVLAADGNARLIEANAAACALTALPRAALLTMTLRDVFTEHPQRFDRSWQRFIDTGEFTGGCRLRQQSGRLVTVECV